MDKDLIKFYYQVKGGMMGMRGGSMYPTLKEGWKIEIEPVDARVVKVGDIIVFGRGDLICHRLIGKVIFFKYIYFIQKGDNSSKGGICKAKDLIGRVREVFDEKGQALNKEKWQFNSFKDIKALGYIYLSVYLMKELILKKRSNKVTYFINSFFWRFLLR